MSNALRKLCGARSEDTANGKAGGVVLESKRERAARGCKRAQKPRIPLPLSVPGLPLVLAYGGDRSIREGSEALYCVQEEEGAKGGGDRENEQCGPDPRVALEETERPRELGADQGG